MSQNPTSFFCYSQLFFLSHFMRTLVATLPCLKNSVTLFFERSNLTRFYGDSSSSTILASECFLALFLSFLFLVISIMTSPLSASFFFSTFTGEFFVPSDYLVSGIAILASFFSFSLLFFFCFFSSLAPFSVFSDFSFFYDFIGVAGFVLNSADLFSAFCSLFFFFDFSGLASLMSFSPPSTIVPHS